MLEVAHLDKQVNGKPILKNLSFKVQRGEIAIFLGGSGAGKSTLLRILNHLESYDAGSFFLDKSPLNLSQVNRDHTIGMVFQHFNLFEHLSVEENITLALTKTRNTTKSEAQLIAHTLLERYGLGDKAQEGVQTLSGGQKQRLAIARALALNPQVICLDEPTSALDPRLTSAVAAYIKEIAASGRIVILTTHDMGLLWELDGPLFLMQDGTIVETCTVSRYSASANEFPLLQQFLQKG